MKKLIITALGACTLLSIAYASPQSGVYLTAQGGYAFPATLPSTGSMSTNVGNAFTIDQHKHNYVWGGSFGIQGAVNEHVLAGVEVGYLNMGHTKYDFSIPNSQINMKSTGYQALLTGTYVADNGFDTFIKAGAMHEKTVVEVPPPLSASYQSGTAEKWVPAAAVGVGYNFNNHLGLSLQYERVFGHSYKNYASSGVPSKPLAQNIVTAGISVLFGNPHQL